MDLSRIFMPYRARVRAIVQQARMATIVRCSGDDLERAAQEAERDALAPFLAIADEADAAMHRAADEARRNHLTAPDREQLAHDLGMAERAAVWARRMAERDAAAIVGGLFAIAHDAADTDPPPPWTPKPGDRVRTAPAAILDNDVWNWAGARIRRPDATGAILRRFAGSERVWVIRHDDGSEAPYEADELRPEPEGDTARAWECGCCQTKHEPGTYDCSTCGHGGSVGPSDTMPPEVAADAVRAVRAAQRAHLEERRVPGFFAGEAHVWFPPPPGTTPRRAPEAPAEGFLSGTISTEASLVITNGQGAIAALDAVARYLETHVAALPAEVAQRVIALLAATLPAGPLAPSADVPATLRTIAGLVQTLPAERPELYLGEEPALHAAVGALPGAEAWTQPYPLKAPEEWLDAARATVEGLLVQATRHRPMTAEERAAHKGAP